MAKLTLNTVGSLLDTTTAQTTINNNTTAISNAFDNTLSRDGTSPNQMVSSLDMNSNQILNLPSPASLNSPARLVDVVSNPTILVPPVGTSGAVVGLLNANKTDSGNNTFSGTTTFTGLVNGLGHISPSNFGAKGDVIGALVTANVTSGNPSVSFTGTSFSSSDVGKKIVIVNTTVIETWINSTISAVVSPTQITLSSNPTWSTTGGTVYVYYGTDDSTAIQNCINSAITNNTAVFLDKFYFCASELTVNAHLKMFGIGNENSEGWNEKGQLGTGNLSPFYTPVPSKGCGIVCTPAQNGIRVTTTKAVTFSDFGIYALGYSVYNTGYTGLTCQIPVPTDGGFQLGSVLERLVIVGFDRCVTFNQCEAFIVNDCCFYQFQTMGMLILASADGSTAHPKPAGNWKLNGNTWLTLSNAVATIIGLWSADGGWGQVVNNKFNAGGYPQGVGNFSAAIHISPINTTNTYFEPPVIVGNSIEGWTYGIQMYPSGANAASVSLSTISGNQIWCNTPIRLVASSGSFAGLPVGVWISGLTISGNVMCSQGAGNYCLVLDGCTYVAVTGNTLIYSAGASSSVVYTGTYTASIVKSGNASNGTIV